MPMGTEMVCRSLARRLSASRFAREASTLTVGRASAAAVSAAWLGLVAHRLGVKSFGQLALLLALHQVFFFLADPGTSVLLADHVARTGVLSRSTLGRALTQRGAGAAVAVPVIGVAYAATGGAHPVLVTTL